MKEQIIRFFKMWTLPLGMFAGVGVYLSDVPLHPVAQSAESAGEGS